MKNTKSNTTLKTLKTFARIGLISIGLLLFIFTSLPEENNSKDIAGWITEVLPNTIPWVIMLLIVMATLRKDLLAGISIVIYGIAIAVFFYSRHSQVFFTFPLIISLATIFFGVILIYSWMQGRSPN